MKKTTEALVAAYCITMITTVFSVFAYAIRKSTVRKSEELKVTIEKQRELIEQLTERLKQVTTK